MLKRLLCIINYSAKIYKDKHIYVFSINLLSSLISGKIITYQRIEQNKFLCDLSSVSAWFVYLYTCWPVKMSLT